MTRALFVVPGDTMHVEVALHFINIDKLFTAQSHSVRGPREDFSKVVSKVKLL